MRQAGPPGPVLRRRRRRSAGVRLPPGGRGVRATAASGGRLARLRSGTL